MCETIFTQSLNRTQTFQRKQHNTGENRFKAQVERPWLEGRSMSSNPQKQQRGGE